MNSFLAIGSSSVSIRVYRCNVIVRNTEGSDEYVYYCDEEYSRHHLVIDSCRSRFILVGRLGIESTLKDEADAN